LVTTEFGVNTGAVAGLKELVFVKVDLSELKSFNVGKDSLLLLGIVTEFVVVLVVAEDDKVLVTSFAFIASFNAEAIVVASRLFESVELPDGTKVGI
jgi:hypothetical protein